MPNFDRDTADAQLVAEVATALREWQKHSGRAAPTKVLRETVWFFWQNPRLARPRVAGKYPRAARWSAEAASAVGSGTSAGPGQLVVEHIQPMHRLLRRLIDEPLEPDQIAALLREGLEVVVVTKQQADALGDDGSPHDRYRRAGLELGGFRTLDEWQEQAADPVRPAQLADVAAGDLVWDVIGREWIVRDILADGLRVEDAAGDVHDFTWHAIATLGMRPDSPPTTS